MTPNFLNLSINTTLSPLTLKLLISLIMVTESDSCGTRFAQLIKKGFKSPKNISVNLHVCLQWIFNSKNFSGEHDAMTLSNLSTKLASHAPHQTLIHSNC